MIVNSSTIWHPVNMRIAPALLALGLLGCQSAPPPQAKAAQPAPVVLSQAHSEIPPPPPRRPLARLNPRRQSLEVGEAPVQPVARRPMKVGVQVVPQPPQYTPPPSPRVHIEVQTQTGNAAQIEALVAQQREQIRLQNEAHLTQLAQQREQILRQNEWLMNRPQPGQGLTPQMQQIAYPQVGPSLAHQQAERRYLEARADFLNTKYLPPGSPPRYTPESVRAMVGTGMPLPPQMMAQPAVFNPVLQKAQQAEVLRQEMVRTP